MHQMLMLRKGDRSRNARDQKITLQLGNTAQVELFSTSL
jgi:hypothetical protein